MDGFGGFCTYFDSAKAHMEKIALTCRQMDLCLEEP